MTSSIDGVDLPAEGKAMADRKPTKRERLRGMAMLQAYLQFHARKFPRKDREVASWLLLFAWAWYGGKSSDPVPGGYLSSGVKGLERG